jgi:hypothetical protein
MPQSYHEHGISTRGCPLIEVNRSLLLQTLTDRGPFVRGRIIDVTAAAARELGFSGLTQVVVNLAWE